MGSINGLIKSQHPTWPHCTPSHTHAQAAWGDHKSAHKAAATATAASPNAGWAFCTKRGRGRSAVLPNFSWTGSLRPYTIGPTRKVGG